MPFSAFANSIMPDCYLVPIDRNAGRILLIGSPIKIGSAPDYGIKVDDPRVSRTHAVWRRIAGSWVVEDAGSTNGTWVNGARITVPTEASHGDYIWFGGAKFSFQEAKRPLVASGNAPRSVVEPDLLARVQALPPYDFEKLVGKMFTELGFEVTVTKPTSDGGVDVEAINSGVIYRGKYLIQCKRYGIRHKVSRPEIQGFFGCVAAERGAKGIFVTSSSFTRGAREFAKSNGVNLIDGDDLKKLIAKHRLA